MILDREIFFRLHRESFGPIRQDDVDALNLLLPIIEQDGHLTQDLRWVAYFLATSRWETGKTYLPIEEYGNPHYFDKYEPGTRLGKQLGNSQRGDGARFKGRGYVQSTGRANYIKLTHAWNQEHPDRDPLSFTALPRLLLEPEYAYFAASYGMRTGLYTGHTLANHINSRSCNYKAARQIINGFDRSELIASYAGQFEKILRAALMTPSVLITTTTKEDAP